MLHTIATSRAHALHAQGALAAQTGGYARAFGVSAVLLVVAAAVALLVLPQLHPRQPEPEQSVDIIDAVAVTE